VQSSKFGRSGTRHWIRSADHYPMTGDSRRWRATAIA
jgi:hypothetical protein